MKILVESKLINHAWQHVMDSGPANESKAKAVEILSSILRKEDNAENDVEKLLYDLELKYLRLLDKDGLSRLVNVLRDIQGLRTKLGLKSITDDITLEDEINQQLASYNPWHNPTDKPSDITDEDRKWADKEIEKHIETTNREAIIEILDMLSEHRNYNNELSYTIGCKAEELKAKLVGEK